MARKHTYKTVPVERIDVLALLSLLATGCIVALDVAKTKFVAAIATVSGEVVRAVRFDHPDETASFLRLVSTLSEALPGKVTVGLEPTGTYGDALRDALWKLGVPIVMVSPKRTHDSAEIFDGVPSLHDPKSAHIVAKLVSLGLCTRWTPPSPSRVALRALIDRRSFDLDVMERAHGRLEALLARHWPELSRWLDVRQKSALKLLSTYGGPESFAAVPLEEARAFLHQASHGRLTRQVIDGVVASTASLGVSMVDEEVALMREMARQALSSMARATEVDEELKKLASKDEVFMRLAKPFGAYTAAVIVSMCDPRIYVTSRQMEKACGLNLREKSSGESKGNVHITKRGPARVRQVLYLLSLRLIATDATVRAWYMRRRGYSESSKRGAVVAVMRKITRAIGPIARGDAFDSHKLFDVRRLDLEAARALLVVKRPPSPRASMRGTPQRESLPAA